MLKVKNMEKNLSAAVLENHEMPSRAVSQQQELENGVSMFVIGGDTEELPNWSVNRANYKSLGRVEVSDAWSAGIKGTTVHNAVIVKSYTTATAVPAQDSYNAVISYTDQLGTPYQEVAFKASPSGKDIVVPHRMRYVPGGEVRQYLPYVSKAEDGQFRIAAVTEQERYYASAFGIDDPKAYFRNLYEKSAAPRLIETTQPGFEKSVSSVYSRGKQSVDDELPRLVWNGDGFTVGSYAYPYTLVKEERLDEDGRSAETFTDELGNVVLVRRGYSPVADTCYVYDDCDRLVCVVSPEGVSQLESGATYSIDDPLVCDYCYVYRYDARGRLVEKRIPGKGWEYMIYDAGGRVLATQDACMRSAKEDVLYWMKYSYDALGRLVSKTLHHTAANVTREGLQESADEGATILSGQAASLAEYHYDTPFEYEYGWQTLLSDRWLMVYDLPATTRWPEAARLDTMGIFFAPDKTIKREYLINSYFTPEMRPYLLYYIPSDCRQVVSALVASSDKCVETDFRHGPHLVAKVWTTAKSSLSFAPMEGICTAADRSNRTRGLKTAEYLALLGDGMEVAGDAVARFFYYDDMGRIVQIAERNITGGVSRYGMKYDFRGSVLAYEERHQYGSAGTIDIKHTEYAYDKQGRIVSESTTLNGVAGSMAYEYDELGRLSHQLSAGNSASDRFVTEFSYDIRGRSTGISVPRFYMQGMKYSAAGNIVWSKADSPVFGIKDVICTYKYDSLNFLRRASRAEGTKKAMYDMEYDLNGNITYYMRDKYPEKTIGQQYSYVGNILHSMRRTATLAADRPGDYRFGYDRNGNLLYDSESQMYFKYNCLNLLSGASNSSLGASYLWIADGTKARVTGSGSLAGKEYVYLGSLKYDVSHGEKSVQFAGGVIYDSGITMLHVKDHLGSVKLVVANGGAVAFNEYEPFGMLDSDYSRSANLPSELNSYLYNGKERQPFSADTVLDYGARMYDTRLGRWTSPDPLADILCDHTPFGYCIGNPINYTDKHGLIINDPNGDWGNFFGRVPGGYYHGSECDIDAIYCIAQPIEKWIEYPDLDPNWGLGMTLPTFVNWSGIGAGIGSGALGNSKNTYGFDTKGELRIYRPKNGNEFGWTKGNQYIKPIKVAESPLKKVLGRFGTIVGVIGIVDNAIEMYYEDNSENKASLGYDIIMGVIGLAEMPGIIISLVGTYIIKPLYMSYNKRLISEIERGNDGVLYRMDGL